MYFDYALSNVRCDRIKCDVLLLKVQAPLLCRDTPKAISVTICTAGTSYIKNKSVPSRVNPSRQSVAADASRSYSRPDTHVEVE